MNDAAELVVTAAPELQGGNGRVITASPKSEAPAQPGQGLLQGPSVEDGPTRRPTTLREGVIVIASAPGIAGNNVSTPPSERRAVARLRRGADGLPCGRTSGVEEMIMT